MRKVDQGWDLERRNDKQKEPHAVKNGILEFVEACRHATRYRLRYSRPKYMRLIAAQVAQKAELYRQQTECRTPSSDATKSLRHSELKEEYDWLAG